METINYHIQNLDELAFACVPFIKNVGLFLKTTEQYKKDANIKVSLRLPDENEPLVFLAKIVWITPKRERNHLPQGIGVQVVEEETKLIRTKIESLLPDAFAANRSAKTFLE